MKLIYFLRSLFHALWMVVNLARGVWVIGHARVWPRKSLTKYPGTVEISIGKPIPSTGRDPIELMKEVEDWIEAEMRRIDPDAYAGKAHVA